MPVALSVIYVCSFILYQAIFVSLCVLCLVIVSLLWVLIPSRRRPLFPLLRDDAPGLLWIKNIVMCVTCHTFSRRVWIFLFSPLFDILPSCPIIYQSAYGTRLLLDIQ